MPWKPEDHSRESYVPGGRRHPLVDRAPLIADVESRYPDVEGDLLPHLERKYRSAVSRALMLPEDDPSFEEALAHYAPVWENEAQRQAMMAIAASPGGMEKIREAFPGEYDQGEVRPDQVDSLMPPYVRRAMEAHRELEYYRRLQDQDRVLLDSDIAIGTQGGGNLLRDDKTNWFETEAREGSDGRLTGLGGPNYFHAQESPAAVEVAMNPNSPAATGLLGAMNLIPQVTRHSVSKGELAPDRAVQELSNNLGYNYMTEMPTANVPPVDSRGRVPLGNAVAAQADKIRNLQLMAKTQADQGQQFLENFVPDQYNTPAAGFAADLVTDFLDHTGPRALATGVASKVDQVPLKPRISAAPLVNDLKNEVAFNLAVAGAPRESEKVPGTGVQRSMAREAARGPAFEELETHVPQSYVRDSFADTTPAFVKMAMTNPHIQADRLRLARERYEADRNRPLQENMPNLMGYKQ